MTAATIASAIQLTGVSKRFGSTQAVADVDLEIHPGEIHALVGENGAGKSTLGKIIGGLYRADSGTLRVFGREVHRWDAHRAQAAGVVMIAQELSLVPERSVAENVFLGQEHARLGVLLPGLLDRYRDIEDRCGFVLPPTAKVRELRLADRQKVEIMRALARNARVVVMDEPTSALTSDEAQRLHEVMAWLTSQGTAVIYVTHFLDAVLGHSDRVTVMRDGRVVRTSHTPEETKESLVEAMLGRSLDVAFPELPPTPAPDAEPALALRNVSRGLVQDVSLDVRPGEIVGLAGLVGSGRTEIARLVFGADRPESGEVLVAGRPVHHHAPRRSVTRGVALIPEDRRGQGLVLLRNVRENVTLPHLAGLSRFGVVSRRRERRRVAELVERLNVHPARVEGDVSVFSGGNQQKVLFAKWLLGRPSVLVLDEPTRGVDIGAKQTIYQLIADIAAAGTAVMLISSEHEEVMGLAHRVLLLRDGRLCGEADPRTTTMDDLLYALFGVDHAPTPSPTNQR